MFFDFGLCAFCGKGSGNNSSRLSRKHTAVRTVLAADQEGDKTWRGFLKELKARDKAAGQ
jgi:hypothetical protein